jgi:hypothetical protein
VGAATGGTPTRPQDGHQGTLENTFKLDRVVIDAANLMFLAMLKQAKAGFTEDLDPALNEFQYTLNKAMDNFSKTKLILQQGGGRTPGRAW